MQPGTASSLLVRTVDKQGADTVTTTLDDYRDAGPVRLPFHQVIDRTDATGRTDPRARTEVRFDRAAVDVPVADAQFAVPVMAETARLEGGVTRVPFELINNHIFVSATLGAIVLLLLIRLIRRA